MWIKPQQFLLLKMETQLKSGIALINFHHAEKVTMPSVKSTYTIPDPHLSHTGSFCAFPTDDPIFVEGAFTLRKPDGLSESPTKHQRNTFTRTHLFQNTTITITFHIRKKRFHEANKSWICTCLQNLLKHPEWSRLARRLVRLLVLLQHLVDFGICCNGRPLPCRSGLWWSSAKQKQTFKACSSIYFTGYVISVRGRVIKGFSVMNWLLMV